jgi:hypothetical protein
MKITTRMIFITIKKTKMETVNSLSGGKTSSYMAVHYPADYNILLLFVLTTQNAHQKINK